MTQNNDEIDNNQPESRHKMKNFLGNPSRRGWGVKRLNRVPLLIAFGVLFLFLAVIGYTMQTRVGAQSGNKIKPDSQQPQPAKATQVFEKAPLAGIIAQSPESTIQNNKTNASGMPSLNPEQGNQPIVPAIENQRVNNNSPQARLYEERIQKVAQIEQAHEASLESALNAASTVYTGQHTEQHPSSETVSNPVASLDPSTLLASALKSRNALTGLEDETGSEDEPSSNAAKSKRDFLNQLPSGSDYLPNTRVPALSPYEIKAGTVIPSTMLSGVNSDLPGQLLAQVMENVYDSATGKHLLIPQGAKLVGTYDNNVSNGQRRVLIAWHRIIYPDSSSLNLGTMPGADQGGYAGFKDKVNNHVAQVFRTALFLSVITAGAELSQPRPSRGDYSYSSQQIVAGAMGQQMNQLGATSFRRGMNIAPTIEIRPGYRFNVMITKDIILTPWQGSVVSSAPLSGNPGQ